MKIVQSLWTFPRQLTGEDLVRWALSFTLAKRHHGRVELHTDEYGAFLLSDVLGLGYDAVYRTLDGISSEARPSLWAFGKIVAYQAAASQNEPFIHIDDDVFLFKPLPEWFVNSPVVAQCSETYSYYKLCLSTLTDSQRRASSLPPSKWQAYNTGVFGGSGLEFIAGYARGARALVRELMKDPNAKEFCNTVFEQAYLGKVAKEVNQEITPLLVGGYNREQAKELGFCHLMQLKGDPRLTESSLRRLKEFDHGLFERVRRFASDEVPSLRVQCRRKGFRFSGVSPSQFPDWRARNFNPTLDNEGHKAFYRSQPSTFSEGRSEIWVADMDPGENPHLTNHRRVLWGPRHLEDPRIFMHGCRKGLAFVEADHSGSEWSCRQRAVLLDTLEDVSLPDTGKLREKNWGFFDAPGLRAVYSIVPHVVLEIGGPGRWEVGWAPEWKWGELRGGSTPVLHDGLYWVFFHSSDGEITNRRYHVGAYSFDPKPPFRPVQITRAPLLSGSANELAFGDPDNPTYNPRCVFPASAFVLADRWVVSVGVNDTSSAVVEIPIRLLASELVVAGGRRG